MKPIPLNPKRRNWRWLLLPGLLLAALAAYLAYAFLFPNRGSGRWARYVALRADPETFAQYALQLGMICGDAPFAFPTTGVIFGLWDQSYRLGHRHQGIDIFAGTEAGVTPVHAAYPGYLTRLDDWASTVIVRVPSDPLNPGRQIWVYYTHMATQEGESFIADEFPSGTSEVYVEAGTLLGYQGDYSGDPDNPTGLHLHLSIVRDAEGLFLNELDIENTYDPSPYFNLPLNHNSNASDFPLCAAEDISYAEWAENAIDE